MSTGSSCRRVLQLEHCNREMFGDVVLTCPNPKFFETIDSPRGIQSEPIASLVEVAKFRKTSLQNNNNNSTCCGNLKCCQNDISDSSKSISRRRASDLMEELLIDIYNNVHHRPQSSNGSDYNSHTSCRSNFSYFHEIQQLQSKDVSALRELAGSLASHVERAGSTLVRRLKRRDALRRQQDAHCDVITGQLVKRCGAEESAAAGVAFSIQPAPGESGFSQWAAAMKMVAQLSGGIPTEFRRRLWLTLAERHLAARCVDWPRVERDCFSEWSHPADAELGVQIVKDLHRTGCSLFCGEDGVENQALLKKVLLAYARWNKAVGYCQGFNMLAALLLQVTDKSETDALKLMIYLIEGVLPDSYFADSLRGLSVDMAVFRELLRARLPRLSKHLDTLQNAAKDGTTSYEPPLTNVFTMQWFLTLFCNCLPQPSVLRVWDLIMLEGNEVLLRTALAIWQTLAERILGVKSADEFYCMMGVLTRELLEFELIDGNALIKAVVAIGPLSELKSLREHYLYNINPWGAAVPASVERQVNVYPARDRLVLDISALKKQYAKLKQRQRQAHIIFSAAISRQPARSAPVAMNHLLLGKSALVPARRLGPPRPGTIPPARHQPPSTLLWKDAPARRQSDSSSSTDTELCDDPSDSSSDEEQPEEQASAIPSQFTTQDNPENLMKNDNISTVVDDVVVVVAESVEDNAEEEQQSEIVANLTTSCSQISLKSDNIFDKATSSSLGKTNDLLIFNSETEDEEDADSVDFEKFLQDRVSFFKSNETSPVDAEKEKPEAFVNKFARRNSERALQIIQENSLILHRIMQCQSRLSPPIVGEANNADRAENGGEETETADDGHSSRDNVLFEFESTKLGEYSWKEAETKPLSPPPEEKSPEYGSRYSSILEKSKNLDAKFNSLIANSSVNLSKAFQFDGEKPENREELDLVRFADEASVPPSGEPPVRIPRSASVSPKKSPEQVKLSPSKVFNPFPVPLSSRQSKEVPLKLGLYKK